MALGVFFEGFRICFRGFRRCLCILRGRCGCVSIFEGGRIVGVFWVFDVCGDSWGMCVLFTVHLIYIE